MADTFTKAQRSQVMSMIRSRHTRPELAVRKIVWSMGFRYRLHVKGLPGTPDIVLRRLKKAIRVSGCFWHMHTCGGCRIPSTRTRYWRSKLERNRLRDRQNLRAMRRLGWKVLTIWECELRKPEKAALKLRRFLCEESAGDARGRAGHDTHRPALQ